MTLFSKNIFQVSVKISKNLFDRAFLLGNEPESVWICFIFVFKALKIDFFKTFTLSSKLCSEKFSKNIFLHLHPCKSHDALCESQNLKLWKCFRNTPTWLKNIQ